MSKKRNKYILIAILAVFLVLGSIPFTLIVMVPMVVTPAMSYFPLGLNTSWDFNSTDDNGSWTTRRYIGNQYEFIGIDFMIFFHEEHDGTWQNKMWLSKNVHSLVWWGFEDSSTKFVASGGLTYVTEPVRSGQSNGGTTSGTLTIKSDNQISTQNFMGRYTIETIETITVPAGTFQSCIRVHEEENTPEDTADFRVWYAPGVGPVKYDYPKRDNRTDELVSYNIVNDDPFETWLLPKVPRIVIATIIFALLGIVFVVIIVKRLKKRKTGLKEN
ncbi:MAG: hypothetical protein JW891_08175 [Candidatus Lokiarchaeota archaeon]|nr:hypothetical protein [Candidatus Lokiarchaeota archaeon]